MSLKKALLAATIMSLPLAAQAQPVSGLYIAGGGGVNWLQSSKDNIDGAAGTFLRNNNISTGTKTEFDLGWGAVVSLGYGFGNGVRVEVEGNYRENDLDSIRVLGVNPRFQGGRARSYGAMGNAFYDFAFPGLPVQPYIGGGVGYVWHEYDGVRGVGYGANPLRVDIDDTDGSFAYQGIAGVAFPLGMGLTLTAEYRFLGTLEQSLNTRVRTTANSSVDLRGKTDVNDYNHSIFVGLRYAFNQPAPPPPPAAPVAVAPAPAPARTYLVFFDWDRADLTDRARQIIGEAAQNARRVGSTRIEVAGHADRSGTPQYNQRLSQRRAEAVAAELARQGISRNEMVIQAFGESRPLVPTADGVREPQNRRVEIVLR